MTTIEVSILLAGVLIVLVLLGVRVAFATALIGFIGLFVIFAIDKNQGLTRGFLTAVKITGQIPHFGRRALQISRPKYIRWREKSFQADFGIISIRANSIFTGLLCVVNPSLREILATCVSTTMPGMPNAAPSTTLAVLRPTPGRDVRASSSSGTCPSCNSISALLQF